MSGYDLNDIKRRMDATVDVLKTEFSGLRTGRASVNLLDPVTVEVYGSHMPINQLASVSVPEPRMLSVQCWDNSTVGAVDRAIRNAGLGLNPIVEGNVLRVPVPELNQERRAELGKVAAKYAEQARIAVRNIRRDGMDALKKAEKDKDISEDEHKKQSDEVQKATDERIKTIDQMLVTKEKEIMQV